MGDIDAVMRRVKGCQETLVAMLNDDLVDKLDERHFTKLAAIADTLRDIAAGGRPTGPSSSHPLKAVVKSFDLAAIPQVEAVSDNVSPISMPKKKSVAFFADDLGGSSVERDDGLKFIARAYSGFGSFRRQSRIADSGNGIDRIVQRVLSFNAAGMPELVLGGNGPEGPRFSRPISRHTEVFCNVADFEARVAAFVDVPRLDLNGPTSGLLSSELSDRDVLLSAAIAVFGQYSFMADAAIDCEAFVAFVDAVARYHNTTNPFHNAVQSATTLLAVHEYLSQANVSSHFTDNEIAGILVAALCINLGHPGVSNELLLQLQHPLSRIFTVVNTSENLAAAIGLQLLRQYNFFRSQAAEHPLWWLALQETVTELIIGTAPSQHAAQVAFAASLEERGMVSDDDIPGFMACVLRAAAMSFCHMPTKPHARWAQLWATEAYRQAEAERLLGFSSEDSWDSDMPTAVVNAFFTAVAVPYFCALEAFFPPGWARGVLQNQPRYADAAAAVTVDHEVPAWSDQSSAALSIVGTVVPARVATPSPSRTEHYHGMLALFDECEQKGQLQAFGGRLVRLAVALDAQYVGEYARVLLDDADAESSAAAAAATILQTEGALSGHSLSSPTRRSPHTTDACLVALLHMADERLRNPSTRPWSRPRQASLPGPFRSRWQLSTDNTLYAPSASYSSPPASAASPNRL